MSANSILIAALILLPAIALVTWAWFAMAQIEEELHAFGSFEGMHFEIGRHALRSTEEPRWPTTG